MNTAAYADTRYQTMQAVRATEGIKALCYDQQVALLESLIEPGMTVLDVGCGPALPYRAERAYVIGLDPSTESLAQNTDVDERIVGTAAWIKLPSRSVDLAVAFYSFHHMTGPTRGHTLSLRRQALWEMQRVLRPGGRLLIFEMTPWMPTELAQWALWPLAKRLLGTRLDVEFWTAEQYRSAGWLFSGFDGQTFRCSPFATFAPVFTLPWLRLPRLLYPFDAVLYRWRKESHHG